MAADEAPGCDEVPGMVPAPAVEGPGGSKLLRAGSQLSSAPTVATDMDFDGTPGPEQKHSQSSFGSLTDCDGTPSTQASASPTSFVCRPSQMLAGFTKTFSTSSATSPRTEFSASHIERWGDKEETLIIFDWDDTLCPTSNGESATPEELAELRLAVEHVLRAASGLGHVEIVSMACEGWIEDTVERLLPGIKGVLEELNISISLARTGLDNARRRREAFADGRDPSHFLKRTTMAKVIRSFYRAVRSRRSDRHKGRSWKNVLSVGDSNVERFALQDVVMQHVQRDRFGRWKECRCKTLKLKSEPTVVELTQQLRRLSQQLPAFVGHDGDLDFELFGDLDLEAEDKDSPWTPPEPPGVTA